MCYEDKEIKDSSIKIFLPSCELINDLDFISSQNNKELFQIYCNYIFDSIIGLLNNESIMFHIDKNNFGTLYSVSIDKLLQIDYCLIKTYPILSLTTKENHLSCIPQLENIMKYHDTQERVEICEPTVKI